MDIAVGTVGALVMPHNIFLHSALVQSRKIDMSHSGAKQEAIMYNGIESALSLGVTVIINLFVVAVFAEGFFEKGAGAADVGLSTAGECASPLPRSFLQQNSPCRDPGGHGAPCRTSLDGALVPAGLG